MIITLGKRSITYPDISFQAGMNLILGHSGSGKTTLLKAAHGLLKNQFLPGDYIGTAMMPQLAQWSNYMTMREQLTMTLGKDALSRATELGLGEHLDKFPDQLSVGQQQRFWFMWTMLEESSVYLLDEPTSALDDDWAEACIAWLKEHLIHHPDHKIIVVTHDTRLKTAFKNSNTLLL